MRKPMATEWTKDERATVERMALAGASGAEMSNALPGRTRNAVIGFCGREGILMPRSRPKPSVAAAPAPAPAARPKPILAPPVHVDVLPEPAALPALPGINAFYQVRPFRCRFIEAKRPAYDSDCCGESVVDGKSWCRFHYGIVFQTQERRTTTRASKPGDRGRGR